MDEHSHASSLSDEVEAIIKKVRELAGHPAPNINVFLWNSLAKHLTMARDILTVMDMESTPINVGKLRDIKIVNEALSHWIDECEESIPQELKTLAPLWEASIL